MAKKYYSHVTKWRWNENMKSYFPANDYQLNVSKIQQSTCL